MKKIVTTTVGKDFAESSWVLLEQTPETLLIFKPEIHPGGVRGFLARYRLPTGKSWSDIKDLEFERVPPLGAGLKVEIELKTETLEKLKSAIEERAKIVDQGIKRGTKEYVVAESDKVIVVDDESKREIFDKILEKKYSAEFWDSLRESEPELATRLSVGHLHAEKSKVLAELAARLLVRYSETAGADSWQNWIYANNWLFGVNYVKTIEKARINITGSMPDYLFLTADYFVDVLEIKLPEEAVIVSDPSHPGAFKWCPKTNEAIGQVVGYLDDIGRLQAELEREIHRVYGLTVSFVKPRGFILIGKKDGWDVYKKGALRKLNFHLHGIEVLTYTDLAERGRAIAQMYEE